jgi:hypothetical protein
MYRPHQAGSALISLFTPDLLTGFFTLHPPLYSSIYTGKLYLSLALMQLAPSPYRCSLHKNARLVYIRVPYDKNNLHLKLEPARPEQFGVCIFIFSPSFELVTISDKGSGLEHVESDINKKHLVWTYAT